MADINRERLRARPVGVVDDRHFRRKGALTGIGMNPGDSTDAIDEETRVRRAVTPGNDDVPRSSR